MYRVKSKRVEKVYQKYKDNKPEDALSYGRGGMSQRQASKKHGVPQSTISDYIRDRTEPGAVPGRPVVIPRRSEKALTDTVMLAGELWVGKTKKQVLTKVG